MKTELRDVTFILPIRIDSITRLENILVVIDFLYKYFKTEIIVLESSSYNNMILKKMLNKNVRYFFVEDKDSVFYRTKYLNFMTEKVNTPFLGIWDTDIIIDKNQILDSILQLRNDNADIAYPYDGKYLDTSSTIREYFIQKKQISLFKKNQSKMSLLYGEIMFGGAIFVNVERYRYSGLENENFYGWGPEDAERYYRWKSLGYRIYRSKGNLYHLTHHRDINGKYRSEQLARNMLNEVFDTIACSKDEILNKFFNIYNL